jgi:hypothetical protein
VAALFLVRCDVGKRQGVTNVTARARDALYDEGRLLMPLSWEGRAMAVSGEIRTDVMRFATARARSERSRASIWDKMARAYALFTSAAELDARLEGVPAHRRHEVAAAWVEGATRS